VHYLSRLAYVRDGQQGQKNLQTDDRKDISMDDDALILNSEDLISAYRQLVNAASIEDRDRYQAVSATVDRLVIEIEGTVPETMSGFRAKAQAALLLWAGTEDDIPSGDKCTALARSLIRDLAWMPVYQTQASRVRPRLTVIQGGLQASQ
jgi:hypothetical protein